MGHPAALQLLSVPCYAAAGPRGGPPAHRPTTSANLVRRREGRFYMSFLMTRFLRLGGGTLCRRVQSLEELAPYDLVVNCLGAVLAGPWGRVPVWWWRALGVPLAWCASRGWGECAGLGLLPPGAWQRWPACTASFGSRLG